MLRIMNAYLNIFQSVEVLCNWRPVSEFILVYSALVHIGLVFTHIWDNSDNQSLLCDSAFNFVVFLALGTAAALWFTFLCLIHIYVMLMMAYIIIYSKS